MSEIAFVGGTDSDRAGVTAQHATYLAVNAVFDWESLQPIWSGAPDATFFNMNGHVYQGREHWTRLWQFYEGNVASSYWTPFDIGGVVSDDLAVLWCERHTRSDWVGTEPPPAARRYGSDHTSRSTMVFRKEDGDWRVVHVHFSEASTTPRPGGI